MHSDALPERTTELIEFLQQRRGSDIQETAWAILSRIGDTTQTEEEISRLKTELGLGGDDDALERLLLRTAAPRALAQLDQQPVDNEVRNQLGRELQGLLAPKKPLPAGSQAFRLAAKFATLRRFPAGPMDWEIGGMPRSWLVTEPVPVFRRLQLWSFIALKMKGLSPFFHMHVAPSPRRRSLLIEKEVMRSYARMARSMEAQPHIRGLMATAWFHDPAAVRDNPHLEPLNRVYRDNGGFLVNMGFAAADAGFLEHNPARKAEYEAGRLRYRWGLALWPREEAIDWARRHPEFHSG